MIWATAEGVDRVLNNLVSTQSSTRQKADGCR